MGVIDIRLISSIDHIMIQLDLVRRVSVDRIRILLNNMLFGLNCFSII